MANIGVRIRKIRRELDLTQQEFADRIGSKRNTIAKYETGTNDPSTAVISLICREFNVNEEWLRDGIGEPFREAANGIETLLKNMQVNADDPFYRLMLEIGRTYQQLSENSRKVLQEFVNGCIRNAQEHSHIPFDESARTMERVIDKPDTE